MRDSRLLTICKSQQTKDAWSQKVSANGRFHDDKSTIVAKEIVFLTLLAIKSTRADWHVPEKFGKRETKQAIAADACVQIKAE